MLTAGGCLRCNKHLLGLGQRITKSLREAGLVGYQFGTPCVSDGISNGTFGMSYSLQSRDLIADSVETVAGGHWLDGMVTVPGCDKNMYASESPALNSTVVLISAVHVGPASLWLSGG
jgi:dihydroxyacid dehydratase/phosphogluconate dehydratase